MSDLRVKDGRNITEYDMDYGRLDVGTGRTPIPVECEAILIKAGNGIGGDIIYVGGADVDVNNGYELTAGGNITLGFIGLGGYFAANSIYLTSDEDGAEVFYVAYN